MAAADIKPYTCNRGSFPTDQKALQVVKFNGARDEKLYFHVDEKNCPEDEAKCRTKAYVVSGDELLIDKKAGPWACAWFQDRKRPTVGWVKVAGLANQPDAKDSPQRWVGRWQYFDDIITIASKDARLSVEGQAIWYGVKTPDGYRSQHYGELSGSIQPVAGRARYENSSCAADLSRVGKYLVVEDNGNCGGLNVRFNGIYTRR